jgi:hypothetical protein
MEDLIMPPFPIAPGDNPVQEPKTPEPPASV